jgi:hypothetical protein
MAGGAGVNAMGWVTRGMLIVCLAYIFYDDITRWNSLLYREVDYTSLQEHEDNTTLKETVACAGGACEIIRT